MGARRSTVYLLTLAVLVAACGSTKGAVAPTHLTNATNASSAGPAACEVLGSGDVARILHAPEVQVDQGTSNLPRSMCLFQTTTLPMSSLALAVHTSNSAKLAAMFKTLRVGKVRVVTVPPAPTPPFVRPIVVPHLGDEALWQPNVGILVRSGPYEIEVTVKHWNTEDRPNEISAAVIAVQRLARKKS